MRGKNRPADGRDESRALLVCALAFICGSVFGIAAAMNADFGPEQTERLSDSISELASSTVRDRTGPAMISAFKYYLPLLFLGFSLPGTVMVPILAAVRGFTLTSSAAVTAMAFGDRGAVMALALFGLSAVVTLPCFFVLAVRALSASVRLFRISAGAWDMCSGPVYSREYFAVFILCGAVLALYGLADAYFIGVIVEMASSGAV